MKQKIQFAICIVIVMLCLSNYSIAQTVFNKNGSFQNYYGETDATGNSNDFIRKIGIGNFSSNNDEPHAFLHVNSNYLLLPRNGSISTMGEVFRTTSIRDISTYWRMERMKEENAVEYGMLYTLGAAEETELIFSPSDQSGIHFYMQASYEDRETGLFGDLRFNTGQHVTNYPPGIATPRMRILGNNGFVGIGDYRTFSPNYLLHQHNNEDGGTFHQFTTVQTGIGANDGFRTGLDANSNGELNLMNNTSDMHFLTNSTPRATILQGSGFVGIGDYSAFTPRSLLHQHVNNNANVFHQFTNGNTGSGNNTSGFRMGIEFVGGLANRSDVWFRNWQNNGQFNFASNDNVGIQQRRVQIQNQIYLNNEVTRVKIIENDFQNNAFADNPPLALLHLGHHWFPNAGGHRLWMDVGSYTCASTDQLYVGLKEATNSANNPWTTRMDAVINWGDNIQGQEGADNLRVILTTPQVANNGDAGTVEGLEVMRFTPLGRIGVGNFDNVNGSGIQPLRRLEIYDENVENINFPTAIQFNPAPQLRLTFTPNANVNLGINTDFQAMATGDLFINPRNAGVNRFVGINTAAPQNTLEINSTAGVSPRPSGLRFTNLNALSAIDINPNGKVLTVDPNGHVVLTNDVGGGSVNSTCATQDIVARFDNTGNVIQCSDIYNNAASANNRIGFFTNNPQYKFQTKGTSLFTLNNIASPLSVYSLFQSVPQSPVLMVESKDDEGLSILHSGGSWKDLLKIYGDGNKLYHFRSRLNSALTNGVYPGSVTFDHENNAGNIISWLAFNPVSRTAIMKDDFNTNPDFNTPTFINMVGVRNSKLAVEAQGSIQGNDYTYAISAVNRNTDNNNPYAVGIYGVSELSRSSSRTSNVGGWFFAHGANGISQHRTALNMAVRGQANGGSLLSATTNSTNCGGYFQAYGNGVNNNGVFAMATNGTLTNYAVYAYAPNSCANGIGNCPSAAGFFNGAVYTTQNAYFTSDSSLKQNITPIGHNDTLLNDIPVYTFNYDTLNNYGLALEAGTHYGVMAHEVKQVFPQMVRDFLQPAEYDTAGTLISQEKNIQAVNYVEFIPLLIAGYKSQAKEIDSLTNQVATLQSRFDSLVTAVALCCNAPMLNQNTNQNQQSVILDNQLAIVLNQNDPNPFAENTTITWHIPQQEQTTLNAMVVFYDQNGSIIKTVKINEPGAGSLLVYGNKLSSGTYTYSLVVNGKAIETKRMMKVR